MKIYKQPMFIIGFEIFKDLQKNCIFFEQEDFFNKMILIPIEDDSVWYKNDLYTEKLNLNN